MITSLFPPPEYKTLRPLAILIHPGSLNYTKIFNEMMFELKRRRLLKKTSNNCR